MDYVTIVGVLGAGLVLLAFTLNQNGKWSRELLSYNLVNLAGSGALVGYAYLLESYPFLVLNGVWFLVTLKYLVKRS